MQGAYRTGERGEEPATTAVVVGARTAVPFGGQLTWEKS